MNLYQTREAIRQEMAKPQPDEARITQLIQQRDALVAAEQPAQPLTGSEWDAQMLQATHA